MDRDLSRASPDPPRAKALLWAGVLLGPAGWFLQLAVSYLAVEPACAGGSVWLLHAAALVGGALAAAGVLVAWNRWRAIRPQPGAGAADPGRRGHFMALTGLMLSGFFLSVIALGEVANLVYGPCGGTI